MKASVSVALPKLVYVLMEDRAQFDLLDLPMTDHRQHGGKGLLSKLVESAAGVMVVFQFWLPLEEWGG